MQGSLLNARVIKDIVKEKYNIDIKRVKKVNRGTANIYKVDTNDDSYILKEFQLKYKKEDIDKEINVINHLFNDGIKVPEYIKLTNGDLSFIYNDHIIIMQKFIVGYTLEKNKCDLEQTIESAKYLGIIVKSLSNYKHVYSLKSDNWFDYEFDSSIEKYNKMILNVPESIYKDKIIKDIHLKIDIMRRLKSIDFNDLDKTTIKYSHGDYSVMQFIYFDGKINSVIDFVSATDLPIVWEIIRSYSYIYFKNKNGKFDVDGFILYVKEYLKYSNLNKFDFKYMPYIYLIQLLKSSFGYKQYIEDDDLNLLKFGFYRTKVCNSLFNNLEEIANRLEKEFDL